MDDRMTPAQIRARECVAEMANAAWCIGQEGSIARLLERQDARNVRLIEAAIEAAIADTRYERKRYGKVRT
jgi:hypothetical protein